ncbi:hypothetical protein E4T66_18755 [Sinimarinibacterium sp. CAU 1509]|uniref:hypothetical protein n=1 Tax=Sinimarinibacterium sp. CAU 1509 TaxID=2562283 RepID=UPI0010AD98E2|nr:hypothetical protein [Sinimarinibacterium sp. CAU 1509]TJY56608.1 hypothetical protein E4T66_18755 [Sinimarinibacterium sp. CAU 1509]
MSRKTASVLLILGGALSLTGCVGYPVYGPGEVYGGAVYGQSYGYPVYNDNHWSYYDQYPYGYRPYGYSSYNYYNYSGAPYLYSRPSPWYGYGWDDDHRNDHRRPPPGHVYRPGEGHDHDNDHDGNHGSRPPTNRPPANGGWAGIAQPIVKPRPGSNQSNQPPPRTDHRIDNNPPRQQRQSITPPPRTAPQPTPRPTPGRVIRERDPERDVAPKPGTERRERPERQTQRDVDAERQRQR